VKIAVIGTGYVGLVSGACLAERGHDVTCVDIDPAKVARINGGDSPIHEEGLGELLGRNLAAGRLRATTGLPAAVLDADVVFLAVGTPFDGSVIDLSFVRQACEQVGAALSMKDHYCAVVTRSTVVPGTTDDLVLPTLEAASGKRAGSDFGVGMNPEFLREGAAVQDFMNPGRIVLGGLDERTLAVLDEVYDVFPDAEKIRTTSRTAEMIKYASNSLFATLISFSNELANLCTALGGLDIVEVMHGVHLDERITPLLPDGGRITPGLVSYLAAGCGFGGSCFPKDVNALIAHGRRVGAAMPVLEAVMQTNRTQPARMLTLLERRFDSLEGLAVAVLGIAFKAGTDDIRESPAIPIVRALQDRGARVRVYDPVARTQAEIAFAARPPEFADTLEQVVEGVDAVMLVTRWPEFDRLPALLRDRVPGPVVVDGRRALDPRQLAAYEGIGR
jgi:UDPglucose 6-dehydrogenase